MFDAIREKLRQKRIRKEIERVAKNIMAKLRSGDFEPMEYGNLKKGDPWDAIQGNNMIWTYIVDLPVGKPIQYVISYSLKEDKYECYAKTARNNYSNVFQFSTRKISELEARLTELTSHLPSLRERALREYIYYEAQRNPRKKWYNPFVSAEKKREYLEEALNELLEQKKITPREAERIEKYIENLV